MSDKAPGRTVPRAVGQGSGTDSRIHQFPRAAETEEKGSHRVANWAIIGIFIIMAFGAITLAQQFLLPVTLGILLFFVFVPFRRWMDRRRVAPGITAGIVTLGLVMGIAAMAYFISGPTGDLIDDAPQISRQLKQKYEDFRASFREIEQAAEAAAELTEGEQAEREAAAAEDRPATTTSDEQTATARSGTTSTVTATVPGAEDAAGGVPDAVDAARTGALGPGIDPQVTATSTVTTEPESDTEATNTLRVEVASPDQAGIAETALSIGPMVVGQVFFTLFFLFFLLASGDLLYLRIVQSFDTMKEKRAAYLALREIEESLGTYLGSITLINACLGVTIGLAMWAWGMPSPLLWGIAGFLLNFIPYIGAMIGYIGSALVALVVFDDIWVSLLIGGTYLGLTALEGQLVTPQLVARRLQLNAVVVFLTVALWAWLWSVLGMVIAVPVLVVIRVLAEHVPSLEKFGNFLAGEAPPEIEPDDSDDRERGRRPEADATGSSPAAEPAADPARNARPTPG